MDIKTAHRQRTEVVELNNNPSYGWDAVAPDNVYESVRERPRERDSKLNLPKIKRSLSGHKKMVLALVVALVTAALLAVSLSAALGVYRRENEDLRQQLQSLLSEGNTTVTGQHGGNTTTDKQMITDHPERTDDLGTTNPSVTGQNWGNNTTTDEQIITDNPERTDDSGTASPSVTEQHWSDNTTTNKQTTTDNPDNTDDSGTSLSAHTIEITDAPGTSMDNPVGSCRDIPQSRPSGEYWIRTGSDQLPVQVYCVTNHRNCSCDSGRGSWMRIAYVNMTLTDHVCPDGLTLVTRPNEPRRTCTNTREVSCASVMFPTHGVSYSRVCGRVIGYQVGAPEGFLPYDYDPDHTIDDQYVDGVSLTHGRFSRVHVWTFAAARDEIDSGSCPCTRDTDFTGTVPPFVGEDYFCDTGSRTRAQDNVVYAADPLWDGQGCQGTSVCCDLNYPPWFCKGLSQATSDDIELRLCSSRDTSAPDLIESIEIYVY